MFVNCVLFVFEKKKQYKFYYVHQIEHCTIVTD